MLVARVNDDANLNVLWTFQKESWSFVIHNELPFSLESDMKFPTYSNLESVKAYGETWKLRYLFRGQILKAWTLVSFSSSNTILQHCFYVFI